jgi:cyclopropane fatty-acyl-phospholipid synthase-like methyltransferase
MYIDGSYLASNPTWHEADAPWKAEQIRSILVDNAVSFDTAAEIGCGTGEILARLAQAFPRAEFTGYDISPNAYELARKREAPRLTFSLRDVVADPDGRFDVVLVIDVIEHVEDVVGFVRKVRALGGRTVFHIPLDLSAQSVARGWPIMNLRDGVGHIHYFTKDTALALLNDCGYSVLDWRYTPSRLELPNQARSTRIVAPLRRIMHRFDPDLAVRILGGYSLLVLAE